MTESSHVVVVDDDPVTLNTMVRSLNAHGYVANGFTDSKTALAYTAAHRPHIILADMAMSRMDGLELLRCVRCVYREPIVFFAFVTGKVCVSSAVGAIHAGADDVLIKPISPDALVCRLQQHGFFGRRPDVESNMDV